MSTVDHFLPCEKIMCDQRNNTICFINDQNKVNNNFLSSKPSEAKMENSNISKFQKINQYDHPNQYHKIGPYILDQVIGKGNFSVVRLAVHTPTQMQVAIKILKKSKMSKETLEKTYREVHIMKQLSHPYIVKLYQVIDSVDCLFIVMEYAVNGELFDHLSKVGRFSEKEARFKFGQILDAVEYCHQINIVHRDLKAENLLLDKNQNIKLADFGFGSFYENTFLLSTWCGSPPYAAPELFKGEPYVGTKADIWSLGVILYAMVCGTLPFNEPTNIVKLREQVLYGRVLFPYFLSYECENLIQLILNRSPMKRPTIASIKNHKWMQPTFESAHKSEKEVWSSPLQIYNSQRSNTLGADSGFDEPVSDFSKPTSMNLPNLTKTECKDFDFNEHAIQIMERCGINRADICEEIINKKYGSHTATYLLLSERLRFHRQSYPPLKQDYVINHSSIINQSHLKPEVHNPIKFVSDNNQFKPCLSDLVENIDTVFQRVQITDKKCSPQNDRRSPYENIKNNFVSNVTENSFTNNLSPNIDTRESFVQSKRENQPNECQEFQPNTHRRNTSSVIVDVIVPHEQAIQEINSENQRSPLLAFQMNERIQIHSKNESAVNPPEYIISYPREYFSSRNQSNIAPQTCIVFDASKTLKDTHISNGAKFNYNNQLTDSYNPYSNFYHMQSNAAQQMSSLYNYAGVNHHHCHQQKLLSNDNYHQSLSPSRPIMVAAQSINASPCLNNNSYNEIKNGSKQEKKIEMSTLQPCQRNQCSDSSLHYENGFYGQKFSFDNFSPGLDGKNNHFSPSSGPIVQPESNFRNLQIINNFNTPLLIRPNNYPQYNQQVVQIQPHDTLSQERYIISNDQKQFVPFSSDISNQPIPSFNVIPISKFLPTDLNHVKFS